MRNAWVTPDDTPTTSLKRVVWIKKPTPTSKNINKISKIIRDNILRDDFGYTDSDITDFNTAHPKDLVIEDTRASNVWATDAYVKSWKTRADGLVGITLEEPWVKAVTDFREQRVEIEIFKALYGITDAELREKLAYDLQIILSTSGEKRIKAFDNLMVSIAGSGASRYEIYKALRSLIVTSGYKDNPFLLLGFARTTVYKNDAPAFGSKQVDHSQIMNALTAANRWLYSTTSKSVFSTINKREAAALNGWASDMYRETNAPSLSTNRRWINRFLSMSDEERKSYKDGDFIPIVPPGQNTIRPATNAEQDINRLNEDWAETNERWQREDQIGSPTLPTDSRSSEYLQRPGDTYEKEGWDIKKKRGTKKGYQPKLKSVLKPNEFNPSTRANPKADAYGSVLSLYLEAAKWYKFSVRMKAVTKYLNEKDKIEREIVSERVRLKPPRPEVTLKHIEEFRRYGRITANPIERKQIVYTLNQLYILLEEGRAYYK